MSRTRYIVTNWYHFTPESARGRTQTLTSFYEED